MNTPADTPTTRFRWILQIAIAIECVAGAWRFAVVQETALMSWLHGPSDLGGWEIPEPSVLALQQVIAIALVGAALLVLWRPVGWVLVPLGLFQLLVATAMWQMHEGYPLEVALLPVSVETLFPFVTHAARIASPWVLWLVVRSDRFEANPRGAERLARLAIALTFAAHGIEAWQQNPQFIDLILLSAGRLGASLAQETAEWILSAIAVMDLIVALLIVATRWSTVAYYGALWGLVTALSRVTSYGWEAGWVEAALRMSHVALPLWLAFRWRLSTKQAPDAIPTTAHDSATPKQINNAKPLPTESRLYA